MRRSPTKLTERRAQTHKTPAMFDNAHSQSNDGGCEDFSDNDSMFGGDETWLGRAGISGGHRTHFDLTSVSPSPEISSHFIVIPTI